VSSLKCCWEEAQEQKHPRKRETIRKTKIRRWKGSSFPKVTRVRNSIRTHTLHGSRHRREKKHRGGSACERHGSYQSYSQGRKSKGKASVSTAPKICARGTRTQKKKKVTDLLVTKKTPIVRFDRQPRSGQRVEAMGRLFKNPTKSYPQSLGSGGCCTGRPTPIRGTAFPNKRG